MSIFAKIFGKSTRAKYDAAQRTRGNAQAWSKVDYGNADQSMSASVRKVLRARARYECDNNSWLLGMILQHAEDVVATGARLQIDGDQGNALEKEFARWCKAVDLYGTLRTAVVTEIRDGEAFLELLNNPGVRDNCKLYPLLLDAERICSPLTDPDTDDDNQVDGVYLDRYMQPVSYAVAVEHPSVVGLDDRRTKVGADYMCHLFRRERPEQHRGVPQITSALPQIAMLRAYTVAMLAKMENSAAVAGVLKPSVTDVEDELANPPFSEFQLPQRSWMTLPAGYDLQQYQLSDPTDSQSNFALATKIETARCILLTKNVVLGDSSSYNYSSARLDMQSYDRSIRVRRGEIEREVLDKVFAQWWAETHPASAMPEYQWYWPQRGYINPTQETQAEANRLSNGNATIQELCAEQGKDWQAVMRQRYEAERFRRELSTEYGFNLDCGPAFMPAEQAEEEDKEESNEEK